MVPQLAMFERNFTGKAVLTNLDSGAHAATKFVKPEKNDQKSRKFSGSCHYYRKVGHIAADCMKLKYVKEKRDSEKKPTETRVAFLSFNSEVFVSAAGDDNSWYLCRERSWFTKYINLIQIVLFMELV